MECLTAETLRLNERVYTVQKLLGKGKGGYSYLVGDGRGQYVLKQIHHEPCAYYQFGDKLQAELNDYRRLSGLGITMPGLLAVDIGRERLLKEYIEGDTVLTLVLQERLEQAHLAQMERMCGILYAAGLNIDYFPTNFIVQDGVLYYIDFECNAYDAKWNFENWGRSYWSKTPELAEYLQKQDWQE